MSIASILFLCLVLLTVISIVGFMFLWISKIKDNTLSLSELPKVSVLLAARNEEKNIARCFDALLALDYPKDKIEILVGNDSSEDDTLSIIQKYAEKNEHLTCLDINHNVGNTHGKANVLAQLSARAASDYYFVTDADIAVPADWIKTMLAHVSGNVAIVTGVTTTEKGGLLKGLQAIDWIYALGKLKIISDLKIPVTAMGNNMLITREAYEATGGYEKIPFNITEDYALFKEVIKLGWDFKQLYQKEVLGYSRSVGSLLHILHQRKRWMKGGAQLKWMVMIVLLFQPLFYPLILTLMILNPVIGGITWAAKVIIQYALVGLFIHRLKQKWLFIWLPFFEIYQFVLTHLVLIFYLLPIKVVWKGRKY